MKIVDELVKKYKSRERRKKFEKMKEQLDPKPTIRPAKKTVPKK
jgi:hypothetical protein